MEIAPNLTPPIIDDAKSSSLWVWPHTPMKRESKDGIHSRNKHRKRPMNTNHRIRNALIAFLAIEPSANFQAAGFALCTNSCIGSRYALQQVERIRQKLCMQNEIVGETSVSVTKGNRRKSRGSRVVRTRGEKSDNRSIPKKKKESSSDTSSSEFKSLEGFSEMLSHRLLSKEEEQILSQSVICGQRLRDKIKDIVSEKNYLDDINDYSSREGKNTTKNGKLMKQKRKTSRVRASNVLDASQLYGESAARENAVLTDEDIIQKLHLVGGKKELNIILQQASNARSELILCNLRLVLSISRKVYKKQVEIVGSQAYTYDATWNLPSLNEVVQDGILGLSRAVDKYDSSYGYRFSTYASYWIASHVQSSFRSASTGALTVPMNVSLLRSKYNKVLKEYIELNNEVPSDENLAKELGVTPKRLQSVLSATQTLSSLDIPLLSDNKNQQESRRTLLDSLQGTEHDRPETYVELSILRQRLENAMATELSPHERDVIRLRLGLDDGKKRSIREVMQMCGQGNLSMNDIRSTERKAFYKLRKPSALASHGLNNYTDWSDVL